MQIKNKNIILGITGGIAAYKALELTRLLEKAGANVTPVMTSAAKEFVTPLSFATIAKSAVYTGLFQNRTGQGLLDHIALAQKADLVIVAPATANVIGKVATGMADDLLTTLIMATKAPVLFAPAMNTNMYENKIVQGNIKKLNGLSYYFIGPDSGELACGEIGSGRLSPPDVILDAAKDCLSQKDLVGEKILVSAGPTREAIDPVRFVSNPSSGRMGYSIAIEARRRGAEVVLVSGPSYLTAPRGITFIRVTTAEEMAEAALSHYPQSTIVIMAAAVSDYKPKISHLRKVKKNETPLSIELERTEDILKEMGMKKRNQILIGFALETEDLVKNAKKKLNEKNLDLVVANGPGGLDADISEVTLIDKGNHPETLPPLSKEETAGKVLDFIVKKRDIKQ